MASKKIPFDPDRLYQRALTLHNEGKLKEAGIGPVKYPAWQETVEI